MRFLLDENIHPAVAEVAWEMELDVVSVHDLRHRGWSDYEQLEFAAEQKRILVTRNREDYLHWTREFYQARRPHAGVLLVDSGLPHDQPASVARALRRWVQARSYADSDDARFGPYHVDFLKR
jgi:hypothetical protein